MSDINPEQHEARTKITVKSGDTVALCRCWQSKKFPFCDGSHNKLEDNVGPIIVESTE